MLVDNNGLVLSCVCMYSHVCSHANVGLSLLHSPLPNPSITHMSIPALEPTLLKPHAGHSPALIVSIRLKISCVML